MQPYLPIEDYAFLSDCHSTALVSRRGSIDWACFRRFDSPTAFARILDRERGGHFSITPQAEATFDRSYVTDTLVLQTTITTASGSAKLSEAMVMRRGGSQRPLHEMVRIVEGLSGTVAFDVELRPRFDYGLTAPLLCEVDQAAYTAVGGSEALVIHCSMPLTVDRDACRLVGQFEVAAGESGRFLLSSRDAHLVNEVDTTVDDAETRLRETIEWWTRWSAKLDLSGAHAALSRRSAIVLKGLTCAPTGAVIAAATTSLPEQRGGTRNWDYRYSWVRDSSLVLEALAVTGHAEVAKGFRDFLLRSAAGNAHDLQIMYGAYGERRLTEVELDLDGWHGSRPVRIGNGAVTQTQLDVYGHLLDAVETWHDGVSEFESSERDFLRDAVDIAARRWHESDHGIWEMRGEPRHFVHSKVMCWVALDRGISLGALLGADAEHVASWRKVADELREEVMHRGVDPGRGCFRQHYDTDEVDASLLKLPLVGFIDPKHPVMMATVSAIQHDLTVGHDGFIRRYARHVDDGIVGPSGSQHDSDEGVFLVASCWLVENLVLQDRYEEASALFDRVATTSNDLDLFAEEFDVDSSSMLGNFPQAFTHLGMLLAARRLHDGHGKPTRGTSSLRP